MATQKRKRKSRNTATPVMVAGTAVRFEQPKSARKPKPKHKVSEVAVVMAQEINPASGFIGFLREHAIVGLAVGFVIATQVQALVKQLVTSFIDPMYALLFNGQKLSTLSFTLNYHDRTQVFIWGSFAYAMLNFLFVLIAIYLIIKFFNLDHWDKPKEDDK